jgi:hypothetical protein
MTGPAMEVIVKDGQTKQSWTLPKALLFFHASFFRRANAFKEGQENKVTLTNFNPKIFNLFVNFMFYNLYRQELSTSKTDEVYIHAKAWILGNHIDATEFKNYAIKKIWEIYNPFADPYPLATLTPGIIDLVCNNTVEGSPLWNLVLSVAIAYWHDREVIPCENGDHEVWGRLWDVQKEFRDALSQGTNQDYTERSSVIGVLGKYLEELPADDGEK